MAMTRKQKRLSIIALLGGVIAIAALLIFTALRDQIVFFYDPTELAEKAIPVGQAVRIGGLVKEGSWVKQGEENTFTLTDGATEATVSYTGILPDLFREGQGVIAEGALSAPGQFRATTVLAKHDENYVPKEVAESLKERGEWRPDGEEAVAQ
jgi:cytochrome c-type biogenesis protein CcmE